jgi:uncharacterized protein YjbJ (UPF0337 family)
MRIPARRVAIVERFACGARCVVVTRPPTKEIAMNKDQIDGAANQAKGTVKEAVGKTIGDKKMVADGTVDRLTGKVESAVGNAKGTIRDAISKADK